MTNKEATKLIQTIEEDGRNVTSDHIEALALAIKALEERPHGKWIFNKYTGDITCSCCRQSRRDTRTNHILFCNHCGADMRKEADNDKVN